jgi:hypothetical protein
VRTATLVVAAGLLVTGPALGQMLTPPPAQAPAVDAHIPKMPAPAPRVPPRLTDEQRARAVPVQPVKENKRGGWVKPADLPKVEYRGLVDAEGKPEVLSEPPEYAALRRNPTLGEGFMEREDVRKFLADRRTVIERFCVDALDVCEKIDGGVVEATDLGDKSNKAALANLAALLKPLSVGATGGAIEALVDAMYGAKLLDNTQAPFNQKIVNEYNQAALKASDTSTLMKIVLKSPTIEPMWMYHGLLAEAAGALRSAVEGMELDDSTRQAVLESAKNYSPALDRGQKIKVFKDATAGMTLEQRQRLLRRVIEMRPKQ